jgi:hypothetical protein
MLSPRTRDMRKNLSGIAAASVALAAVVLAPGAVATPHPAEQPAPALEAVHAPAAAPGPAPQTLPAPEVLPAPAPEAAPTPAPEAAPVADAAAHVHPEMLPPGDCPEQGLQLKTILAARSISADFPQITHMIGVRPDAKRWHPNGLAVDIMIPNAGSPEGIALGDEILAYALRNADKFGIQDVIWRGVYYTPAGPRGSGYGHFDHVHITTTGGGYPG